MFCKSENSYLCPVTVMTLLLQMSSILKFHMARTMKNNELFSLQRKSNNCDNWFERADVSSILQKTFSVKFAPKKLIIFLNSFVTFHNPGYMLCYMSYCHRLFSFADIHGQHKFSFHTNLSGSTFPSDYQVCVLMVYAVVLLNIVMKNV